MPTVSASSSGEKRRTGKRSAADGLHLQGKQPRLRFLVEQMKLRPTPGVTYDSGDVAAFFAAFDSHTGSADAGDPAAFFAGVRTNGNGAHADFYRNLAVLHYFIGRASGPVRNKLIARAMNFLAEFAPAGRPDSWKSQANPLQQAQLHHYSRYTSVHMWLFRQEIARTLGVNEVTIFPVTDETALRSLEECYEMNHGIGSAADVHALLAHLRRPVAEGGNDDDRDYSECSLGNAVLIDLTDGFIRAGRSMRAGRGGAESRVPSTIRQVVQNTRRMIEAALKADWKRQISVADEQAVRAMVLEDEIALAPATETAQAGSDTASQVLAAAQKKCDAMSLDEMRRLAVNARVQQAMDEIDDDAVPIGLLYVGPQPVIYVGGFVPQEEADADAVPGIASDQVVKCVDNFLQLSGYYPTEHKVMENWAEAVGGDLEKLLSAFHPSGEGRLSVPPAALQEMFTPERLQLRLPMNGPKLCRFDAIDDFFAHPDFEEFSKLPDISTRALIAYLVPPTVRLLKGLKSLSLEQRFADHGLTPLLQWGLNSIAASMREAVEARGSTVAFENRMRLIHAELGTLLQVPGSFTHSDFAAAMLKNSAAIFNGLDAALTPRFHLQNGGMRCLDTIRSACLRQKVADTKDASARLVAVGQRHMYFQNAYILFDRREDRLLFEYTNDWKTAAEALRTTLGDRKIDLFVGEFHHNADDEIGDYCSNDLTALLAYFIENDMVAPSFTMTVDDTLRDDAKLRELGREQDRLRTESKRVNLVAYRSLQKYDFLGMDNYNGGSIMERNDGSFPAFSEMLASARHHADASLQAATYLQMVIGEDMEKYREFIFHSARRMISPDDPIAFPEEMFAAPDSPQPLRVAPASEDSRIGFVHLSLRPGLAQALRELSFSFPNQIKAIFAQLAAESPDEFPIMIRAGFGFPLTNIVSLKDDLRMTPGLEGDECLKRYRDCFVCLNEIMRDQEHTFPLNPAEAIKNALMYGVDLLKLKLQIRSGDKSLDDMATLLNLAEAYRKIGNEGAQNDYRARAAQLLASRGSHSKGGKPSISQ
jgi:hypothetical protein